MHPDVQAAVDTAYRVFARYDVREGLVVCRCDACVAPQVERTLIVLPLREIPASLLGEYTNSAHVWTPVVADQLRYFLPRYFELLAVGEIPNALGMETCLIRLHEADWRTSWPRAEADAIMGFFTARFRALLETSSPALAEFPGLPSHDADPAEDWLCMVAHAGGDIAPLLAVWDDATGLNAALRLANVIGGADWSAGRLRNEGWDASDHGEAAMTDVMAWLRRPSIRARLETACLAAGNADAAALLSMAEGIAAELQP